MSTSNPPADRGARYQATPDEMDFDFDPDSRPGWGLDEDDQQDDADHEQAADDEASFDEDPSLWVFVPLPDAIAGQLALPGGEPAEGLHLTLAYIGRRSELPAGAPEAAGAALEALMGQFGPLEATIQGIGRFSSPEPDGEDVVYASVDAVGLATLRQAICRALADAGVPPQAEHDWTPHVTLAYVAPEADIPRRLDPLDFDIESFRLGLLDGSEADYPLQGTEVRAYGRVMAEDEPPPPPQSERDLHAALGALASAQPPEPTVLGAQALDGLRLRLREAYFSDDLDPDDKIAQSRNLHELVPVDALAAKLQQGYRAAAKLGREAAAAVVEQARRTAPAARSYAASPVNPTSPDELGAFEVILKSRSYRAADGMAREAAARIAFMLDQAYLTGESNRDTEARLSALFEELVSDRLIHPPEPRQRGSFRSPQVVETIVRTNLGNWSDQGKQQVYKRNQRYVPGFRRIEVADGKEPGRDGKMRSHPLSKYLANLRVRWDHPQAQQLVGAQHHGERGGIIGIMAREAESSGFVWSTDAEIARALAKKAQLSSDFV